MVSFPKSEWINNWGINHYNADSLYKHILKTKPYIILETGTFEAQATYVMAKAANENNNNCIIYTIFSNWASWWVNCKILAVNNITNNYKHYYLVI